MNIFLIFINLILWATGPKTSETFEVYIRVNQVGYLPGESKTAIVFSKQSVRENFNLLNVEGQIAKVIKPVRSKADGWDSFPYNYSLDFTDIQQEGSYALVGVKSGAKSTTFKISTKAYSGYSNDLLGFMQQQRCGYNPFLDIVCHQRDGRSMYGKMPDSTFVDASGGWHDAGDQLKYLITGSYATAHMLMAYELYLDRFEDKVNHLGQPGPNGISDILDEAKWGLDWLLKLHHTPDQLIHQIADDRDHRGWKMPDNDPSDFGWGPNSYRVAYFATGKPQGLNKYKSIATGMANLAGRSAAALTIGSRIWRNIDRSFSEKCLRSAKSLYQLGKDNEGFQQGNSYGAPYRYTEETWADDMEWGAAELYKVTKENSYLEDAKKYARQINVTSWMELDSAAHYQYYPFINMGHYALYESVDEDFKNTLASYYRSGIENTKKRASSNAFGIGVPFIWCSNNLLTSLITQTILYEKMTGDESYRQFMTEQKDWLFGRNPWGTSMFMNIPENGEYPVDVHTSIWAMTKQEVPGGLVDGPVFGSIYKLLSALVLSNDDEFGEVQNSYVVYHDDIGDYSTNEPTMDGTAGSLIMMGYFSPVIK
ncbi:MAG: glycoside hydrolase family 9 protein [Bacteroidetes bacterium]|nr:glycoside hydrolase family 9 protein [Bacteroidota bacterium]MDA1121789.1 glycoside hydrolase family 9 protein [Bacteroidota bacterium]